MGYMVEKVAERVVGYMVERVAEKDTMMVRYIYLMGQYNGPMDFVCDRTQVLAFLKMFAFLEHVSL